MRRLLPLLLLLGLAACDRTADGRDAYAEGRYGDAKASFAEAIADAGDDASPELYYDLALAELQLGEPAKAQDAAERAEAIGGEAWAARSAFIRGSAAYAKALEAAKAAAEPGADARAMQWAIALAEDALAAWRYAAATELDWPAARRNVERALLLLQRLREQRSGNPNQKKPDEKDEPDKPDEPPEELPSTVEMKALPAGRVFQVLDVLAVKQREKQKQRREAQAKRTGTVERDW